MNPLRTLLLCSALALALAYTTATAQALDDSLKAAVDSVFIDYNRTDAPGCALGIYDEGDILYAKGYGMADLEGNVPITSRTVFDIASVSKQFTAASLILLEHKGKLSLEDDVRDYIPELPDYGETITLRQLVVHTSGLRDYIGLMQMVGVHINDVTTGEDAFDYIVRQKALNFEPGDEHLYSNSGYLLAAFIVERVSGLTLREFARKHIFEPLGMRHTTYIDDHTEIKPFRATGYGLTESGAFRRAVSNWEQNGDGAVFTTVEDLARWDRNFVEPSVGGEGFSSELMRPGVLANGDTLSYAHGLSHGQHRGFETIGHGGSWGGYRAHFLRVPSEGLSVAILCNVASANPGALAREVVDVVLAPDVDEADREEESPEPVAISQEEMERIAGRYRSSEHGEYRSIVLEDEQLYYEQRDDRWKLIPVGEGRFWREETPTARVLVERRAEEGESLTLEWREGDDELYTLTAYEPWTPAADELEAFVGRYHSDELETAYTLTVENDTLIAHHASHGQIALKPRETDVFTGEKWVLAHVAFDRDEAGQVEGFLVSIGRTRNLLFEKVE